MIPLTETAHSLVRPVLRPGDIAIDATVGNGFDTLFLAECVGPSGSVYGFDIQSVALEKTQRRLADAGVRNVTLFHVSHAEISKCLANVPPKSVSAVMLNLGYLPGGDKGLTTSIESTRVAIRDCLARMTEGAIMTILAYPGHSGGAEETAEVERVLQQLPRPAYEVQEICGTAPLGFDISRVPRLFVVRVGLGHEEATPFFSRNRAGIK